MNKKLFLLALLSISQTHAQSTSAAPYCDAIYNGGFIDVPHYISQVEFGTLNNISGTTQYVTPHYVFYDNLATASFTKGSMINLTISHDDGASIHGIAAWIDFNNDHDFDDPGEQVGQTLWPGDDDASTGTSVQYNVTIPITAVSGNTRMRVRVYEDDAYTFSGTDLPVLPCKYNTNMNYDWGETEDYTINILAGSSSGLNELNNEFRFVRFENQIKVNTEFIPSNMAIINSQGAVISSSKLTNTIEIPHVISGIYFLEITAKNGQILRKKINL